MILNVSADSWPGKVSKNVIPRFLVAKMSTCPSRSSRSLSKLAPLSFWDTRLPWAAGLLHTALHPVPSTWDHPAWLPQSGAILLLLPHHVIPCERISHYDKFTSSLSSSSSSPQLRHPHLRGLLWGLHYSLWVSPECV